MASCGTLLPSIFPTDTITTTSVFPINSSFPALRITTSCRRRRLIYAAASTGTGTTPDYYKVLKLRKNATLQEIKSSYRSLARKVVGISGSSVGPVEHHYGFCQTSLEVASKSVMSDNRIDVERVGQWNQWQLQNFFLCVTVTVCVLVLGCLMNSFFTSTGHRISKITFILGSRITYDDNHINNVLVQTSTYSKSLKQ